MYKYKIGCYGYNTSHYVELEHKEKFTYDEITDIIADCILEIVPIMYDNKSFLHSFQDIICGNYNDIDVVKLLIENKGFKLLDYAEKWKVCGDAPLFNDKIIKDDKEVNTIRQKLKDAGFNIEKYDSMEQEDD